MAPLASDCRSAMVGQHCGKVGGRDHVAERGEGVELEPRPQVDADGGGVLIQDQPQAVALGRQHEVEIRDVVEARFAGGLTGLSLRQANTISSSMM